MTNKKTHYDTLGLPHFSSLDDCKKAWRTKTFSQHPDLFKDEADKIVQTEVIKELNKAWYVLGDANRKNEYDNQLRLERQADITPPPPEKKKWTIWNIIVAVLAIIALLRVGLWLLKAVLHFFLAQ